MKFSCHRGVVLASTVAALPAVAQMPGIDHSAAWAEVIAGSHLPVQTPNGVLEPGEAMLLDITFSFTPVGTPAAYYIPAPGGVAPVSGFCNSTFGIFAANASIGSWSQPTASAGFLGFMLFPEPEGSIGFSSLVQETSALADNPVHWSAVWTPVSYEPRQASFRVAQSTASVERPFGLWVDMGPGLSGVARAMGLFDNAIVQIPIIPAPPGCALCLCSFFGARRCRRVSRRSIG
jgi:hypothetical protein